MSTGSENAPHAICNSSVLYAIIVIQFSIYHILYYHILHQSVPPLGVSALHIFEDSQEENVCIDHLYESVDFKLSLRDS